MHAPGFLVKNDEFAKMENQKIDVCLILCYDKDTKVN